LDRPQFAMLELENVTLSSLPLTRNWPLEFLSNPHETLTSTLFLLKAISVDSPVISNCWF
jgi:hypothetical protein